MKILHRCNSDSRQHYQMDRHYPIQLRPRLLYAGYLDRDRDFSEEAHAHEFLEVIFITDGKGRVLINGEEKEVCRGDLVIYNAGVTHRERADRDDPFTMLFLAYDGLKLTALPQNSLIPASGECIFRTGDMYGAFSDALGAIIRELEGEEPFYTEVVQGMSETLIHLILRLISRAPDSPGIIGTGRIIDSALAYIDTHYSEKISLEAIAAACYTNKYHLSHIFTQEEGMSVWKYILKKRILSSTVLLADGRLSVEDVAALVGFGDPGYYCRVFKSSTGMTPSAWRRKNAGKPEEGKNP